MRTSIILITVVAIVALAYAATRTTSSPEPEPPVAGSPTPSQAGSAQADRCILTISGARYDVTDYLNQHPGGRSRIIPFCGKDATEAFRTQGGGGSHSGIARETLEQYRLP